MKQPFVTNAAIHCIEPKVVGRESRPSLTQRTGRSIGPVSNAAAQPRKPPFLVNAEMFREPMTELADETDLG